LKAGGTQARAIRADVAREAEVEAMLAEMLGAWGRIDILVSNAGLQRDAPFTEMTLEQWNTVLGVNLTGMFLCARAAARALIPYGRIGQPEDIGRTAVWLASDAADYVHGQTIFVDGGMTLYPGFARGG